MKPLIPVLLCAVALTGCGSSSDNNADSSINDSPDKYGFSAPTAATIRANADVLNQLPFANQQDFADARRGLIASADKLRIDGPGSGPVWDLTAYDFIQGDAPASVNPSLWRQAKLNNIHGLFEVTEGIYQLRGFDLANMTLIDGEKGWIVVDPLTSKETAHYAFEFAMQHLQRKPISAVIFTHSHVDHFGGATALVSAEEIASGKVDLIAPEGFMEEATSENSMAGMAMYRRALYMYGKRLPRSERAHVDTGLGKEPALGSSSVLPPNYLVTETPQQHVIDGVPFVFQNAPHSEAPAELTFYLPEHNAWCGAELVSQQMHNVYTLRGAKVRDSLNWSNTIDDVIQRFGNAEIYFGSHHWPIWGNAQVVDFLKKQRDVYKYIHDQTIRMANAGLTPREIAEQIQLPASLRNNFSTRGYYGTVSHNVKAVYQFYFGWYDGNPANLNPLPPVDSAKKTIEFMGGADAVLSKAQRSFDDGEYRWVAEVLNHLVFAEPDNDDAKALLAKTYDQLGYIAESGPWRDVYLSGAYELRHGGPEHGMDLALAAEQLQYMPLPRFLDTIAVGLDGPKAEGENLTVNFVFPDLNQSYVLQVENAVLHYWQRQPDPNANATLTLTHDLFLRLLTRQASAKEVLFSDELEVTGSKLDLIRFFSLFSMADGKFDIVTP
ncbi:alkyl/aryl-sulfatase [Microbulbifer sp. S227A]|uniref:alkyl/aryl-sulfatase n=1 Tax=Microbulbifer sp. S227A TaxID=3415131 RepID=UPI003C7C5904